MKNSYNNNIHIIVYEVNRIRKPIAKSSTNITHNFHV